MRFFSFGEPSDSVIARLAVPADPARSVTFLVLRTIDGLEPEGTIKTYHKVDRQIWLMPQNSAYTPIPGDNARVAGKVVAVLRRI